MRAGPADASEPRALLASVEEGGAPCAADDDGPPLDSAVARALAELLHPGAAAESPGVPDDGWRAVVVGTHRRAVALADGHPASWALATSSAVLVDDWVGSGSWAGALRAALERDGASRAAVRDAPVVVALHLFAVRPRDAGPLEEAQSSTALAAFPHVTRLRSLLSSAGPVDEPGGPAALGAAVAAVERLLR